MMRKLLMIAAGVVVLLLGGWIVAGYVPTRGIETPKYELVSKAKGYEIRQYAPRIVAEVEVSGTYKDSLNQGFRKVADYIFGNNSVKGSISMTAPVLHEKQPASEKISMTAPVLHEKAGEKGTYKLAFVMPSKYTMDTLPKPNNPDISLRPVPQKKYAVRTYGGYATEGKVERETNKLLDALKQDSLATVGTPVSAQFNPPWTPPFMRHNEVMVELQ
jgi:hypothetical protein